MPKMRLSLLLVGLGVLCAASLLPISAAPALTATFSGFTECDGVGSSTPPFCFAATGSAAQVAAVYAENAGDVDLQVVSVEVLTEASVVSGTCATGVVTSVDPVTSLPLLAVGGGPQKVADLKLSLSPAGTSDYQAGDACVIGGAVIRVGANQAP
jgi:hypothetical protein